MFIFFDFDEAKILPLFQENYIEEKHSCKTCDELS